MEREATNNGPPEPPARSIETGKLIGALGSVVLSGVFYAAMLMSAPAFAELFAGFGANLPWITSTIFAVYRWFGILILIGLVPCIMLLQNRSAPSAKTGSLVLMVVVSFVLSFVLFGLYVFAIYYPIFKMGAVL